jgi:hypothetical protein
VGKLGKIENIFYQKYPENKLTVSEFAKPMELR